ncbi:MAG: peptide ABC transporter ATP-binding protein [Chloroflexi bacterium RBG_13_52_12]|nr:MAG: peptide ABC transporter ATP-binding protein [Chloroflexi bacterium RBG_13_52_12]
MAPLLKVENLKTYFHTYRGLVKAVDGVSFEINEKEIIGLVGESGCGKSVSMLSILQLISSPPGEIVSGTVMFEGHDLLQYGPKSEVMSSIRGAKIGMIFQEPMTSLNPVLTIRRQLTESMEIHLNMTPQTAEERAIELLRLVGISDSKNRLDAYPHQFSGGMRQRVMIAIALSCNPKILIADEPTTAVDVTTQAQLLELMQDMVNRINTSLVIVTHNLGVVARYAERIYVMYSGRIVESGLADDIFLNPRHPYTIGLLKCVPQLGETRQERRLVPIKGMPPNLINMPSNCAFLPRCDYVSDICRQKPWPPLVPVEGQHYIACFKDVSEKP